MCVKNIWYPITYTCENGKYSGEIINNSVISCDEIMQVTKAAPTKASETNFFTHLFINHCSIIHNY